MVCVLARMTVRQTSWLGSDPIQATLILLNMLVSFVTFSICLSYLNVGRIKLAAKLLRTRLFDALADVDTGT